MLMYVLAFTTDNAFPLHFFSKETRTRSIILTSILISTINNIDCGLENIEKNCQYYF